MTTNKPLVSVVSPVYEEEEVLPHFHRVLADVLDGLADEYDMEIIYIDDGSSDGTLPLLRRLARQDARVRYYSFSRNFGHQAALTAGMERARGACPSPSICSTRATTPSAATSATRRP